MLFPISKIHLSTFLLFLGFALIKSPVCYSQNWVAEYDSHLQEHHRFYEELSYGEAYDEAYKAYLIAELHQDTTHAFNAFILAIEKLLNLGELDTVFEELKSFEAKYNNSLTPSQFSKLKSTYGWYSFDSGRFQESYNYATEALEIAKPINDSARIEAGYRIQSYSKMHLGEAHRAIELGKQALAYNSDDLLHLVIMSWGMYMAYQNLGMIEKGLPHLIDGLAAVKKLDNAYFLSNTYLFLSDYYIYQRDFATAINYSLEGLEILKALKNSELHEAILNEGIGDIYASINQFELAAIYYKNAYDVYNSSYIFSYYKYYTNQRLAGALIKTGKFYEAEQLLDQALSHYESIADTVQITSTYFRFIKLELAKKNYDQAYRYLQKAISLNEVSDYNTNIYKHHLYFPDNIIPLEEKLEIGLSYLEESRTIALFEIEALIVNARLHFETNPDMAFTFAEEALALLEKMYVPGQIFKAHVHSEYANFYTEVGAWYALNKNNYNRAFQLFEHVKSRVLIADLLSKNKNHGFDTESSVSNKAISLKKEIDQIYFENNNSIDLETRIELRNKNLEYELLLDSIRIVNPEFSFDPKSEPVSLDHTQQLLNDDTAIIEYGLTEEQLFIFVITRGDVQFFASEKDENLKEILLAHINQFRSGIINIEPREILEEYSTPLNDLLIQPILSSIEEYSNLVIVPDESLALLPFEALWIKGEYFIEYFTVKYLPSISVYEEIQPPFHPTNYDLFSLAGSDFEIGNLGISTTRAGYISLPFTLIEVDSVSSKFERTTVLKNEPNAEEILKSLDLSEYSYLHFATHAEIDEIFPEQSGLFLSRKVISNPSLEEDGFLNIREIQNLELNADLVVLSACNTATGKVINGEGLMSINRAFLVAGASSVISGLWSIYDRSTHEFMKVFYDNLLEFEDREISWFDKITIWRDRYEPSLIDYKTLALHQTKLEMMNHPYYSHPVHWASFVITGK